MNSSILEIQQKLDLTIDDLMIELGSYAIRSSVQSDLLRKGKEIFWNLLDQVGDDICKSEEVYKALETTHGSDKVFLVSALLDVLTGLVYGISPVTFAVLVVKVGISELCEESWKEMPGRNGGN